jgi:ACS family sodium-dependent inorganic phosphate cotransporter
VQEKFAWGRRHSLVLLMFLAIVIGYSDRVNISVAGVSMKEQFGWSQTTKGFVLSSFFIGYMSCMFVSGWLCMRFGGKLVLGAAVLWWTAFTLLTPLAANVSTPVLIAARIGMGMGEAAMFPAAVHMIGIWTVGLERDRGNSIVLSGIPLGTVIGLAVTGWIVGHYDWPMAFYVFGVVGFLWAIAWFAIAADDPAGDPRVTPSERAMLAGNRSSPGAAAKRMPWEILLFRSPVWALVATHFATTWTLYMLLSWLPSYFRDVQGVSIANSGFLSAAPWLSMFLMTYVGIWLSQFVIRRTGRVIFGRKLLQCTGLLGSGAMLLLAQYTHSVGAALAVACTATGLLGFCWVGYGSNFLDLAPRHSGLLVGYSNTFATVPGIIGVAIAGWLVDLTGGYSATFAMAAGVSFAGAVIYMIYGSDKVLID